MEQFGANLLPYATNHEINCILLSLNDQIADFICRISSMTSYRQPKRKRVEISRNQDECMNIAVKKSACATVQEPHKATG